MDVREYIPELNPNNEERGLLGLCFHPQFIQNGKFYIFYSSRREYTEKKASYYNCLSEFVSTSNGILYDAEKVILRIRDSAVDGTLSHLVVRIRDSAVDGTLSHLVVRIPRDLNYHNGGKIAFGPDGYLYITVGDGGPQKDPNNHAQDLSLWLGKILRIDVNVDTYPYYRIPSDNPFVNVDNILPEIWAYGFRNPWGLEFHSNILIISDVGFQAGSGQENIYVVQKGGNYGWNIKEGRNIAPWSNIKDARILQNLIDPIFSYSTADPNFCDSDISAIIGGYLDKGGDYICADYSGRLIRLRFNDKNGVSVIETTSINKWIRSFGKIDTQLYIIASETSGPSSNKGSVIALTVV